ncbi:MAG: hypothetical protein M1402_03205 [Candidatus Thermoplasmatota archaeon]|nr:hypothetical protein [Candidatus Thermoplasmatota archaeon]
MSSMFSLEWFEELKNSMNDNSDFQKASSDWDDDLALRIIGDDNSSILKKGKRIEIILKLIHGKCFSIIYSPRNGIRNDGYILEGEATVWEMIFSGDADIIPCIFNGAIRTSGNTAKLMKYTSLLTEMANSAKRI